MLVVNSDVQETGGGEGSGDGGDDDDDDDDEPVRGPSTRRPTRQHPGELMEGIPHPREWRRLEQLEPSVRFLVFPHLPLLMSHLAPSDSRGPPPRGPFSSVGHSLLRRFHCSSSLFCRSCVLCHFVSPPVLCCPSPPPCPSCCLAWCSCSYEHRRGLAEQGVGAGADCGRPVAAGWCTVAGPGCPGLCPGGHAGGTGGVVSGGGRSLLGGTGTSRRSGGGVSVVGWGVVFSLLFVCFSCI